MVTYAYKSTRIFEALCSFCCIMSVTKKPDLFLLILGCVLVFYLYIKYDKLKPNQAAFSLVNLNSACGCVGVCTVYASTLNLCDKIHTVRNHCITHILINCQFYVKQILTSPLW